MKKNLILYGGALYLVLTAITFTMATDQKQVEVQKKPKKSEGTTSSKNLITEGNQAFRAQRYDDAITIYKKAVENDPQSVDAHYNLALTYDKKGMIDESIQSYKQVIHLKPDYGEAHNNLGTVYEKKDMSSKAIAQFKEAVSKDPDLPQAQYNLGRAYFKEGLLVQAAEHLYKGGLLFLKKGDRKWAENSYNLLKNTKSEELEKALYSELYPDRVKREEPL
jgi:tetratricopeptide (TPR) repeat protein